MSATDIRVVLVEDDEDLRSALASFLKMTGFSVASEGTALGFYDRLAREAFDVAIIDLSLPDMNGTRLVEFMRARTDSAVIVLTATHDIDSRVSSYQSGADLFMGKPIDTRELVAAIHSLSARRKKTGPAASTPVSVEETWRLVQSSRILKTPDGASIELTGIEVRVLELLAAARQKVVKHELLAEELYGRVDDSAKKALDSAVGRLRRKIAQSGAAVPIQTSYSVGYSFAASILIS